MIQATPMIQAADSGPPAALLGELAHFLSRARRERQDPAAAQHALAELAGRHRDWPLELVWERESYTGHYHYDVLLRAAEETFSISGCADDTSPWPLRGVQRWSENCVARIDGQTLDVGTAFACIDFWWSELHVGKRLVQRFVVERAQRGVPVDFSDGELDAAMREFRRRRRLFSVADTERWMREHGITQDQIEDHLAIEVRGRGLRTRVAEASVEGPPAAYFERHRADLEILRLARVQVADRDDAERVAERARAGLGLVMIAQDRFVATGRDELRLVAVRAGDLPPGQAAVRSAAPGEVLAPAPAGGGWEVVQLLARSPARYDTETEELIAERLFARWLEHEAAQLHVEWFWGAAQPQHLES